MGRWTTVLFWAVLAAAGCGERETPDATTLRSDSAGVLIVQNVGPDRSVPLSVSVDYRLGGEPSGPESFYQLYPFQISVGATGVIGVLNQQGYQASTYGPDGVLLSTYGREGGGPGEFRFPSSIAVRPTGEVLVYDYAKRALVGFAPDGTVLEESRLTVPFHGVAMVATQTGLLLMSESRPRGPGEGSKRILHVSPTDTVQLGPTTNTTLKTVFYESCGMSMSQPPLFASDMAWGSNGSRTVVAAGPEYSMWIFEDTTLVGIVRRDLQPEVVTEAIARREVGEGEHWSAGGRECLVPAREVLEQRGYGSAVPIIEALAVTPDGGLWVRRRSPGTQVRAVDRFDSDGRYLETVTPTPPFPIAFLPDGRLVTIEEDSLDIERVAVYRVGSEGT